MCGIRCTFPLETKLQTYSPDLQQQQQQAFQSLRHRGPDASSLVSITDTIQLGFHRLAIHDLTASGDQPFCLETDQHIHYLVCNGEIYNYKFLQQQEQFALRSHSDCEIILHLYDRYGIDETVHKIHGEFACIIISRDKRTDRYTLSVARDPIGVRPLFWGYDAQHKIGYLSSELKGLIGITTYSDVFAPGTWQTWSDGGTKVTKISYDYTTLMPSSQLVSQSQALGEIQKTLTDSVREKLDSERPVACLLSGGLDSSIVSALAAQDLGDKLHTFTIGMEGGTDLPFAQQVAEHIGSQHTVVKFSFEEALQAIDETIYAIESFDITTVRASVWQFLLARYISTHTDTKVILCGELSDELLSGYKYFHSAPSGQAMHEENIRLIKDVHRYDGLRTDRTMAYHGLEVRLPFADTRFVGLITSLPAARRMPQDGMEKWILRQSFAHTGLLPDAILRRSKEAFSDGVSSREKSRFTLIQEHIDMLVSDEEFVIESKKFVHCPPHTKEAYYYRKKFVEYFGDQHSHVVPYFWLPKWSGDVSEPSARVLETYSG